MKRLPRLNLTRNPNLNPSVPSVEIESKITIKSKNPGASSLSAPLEAAARF